MNRIVQHGVVLGTWWCLLVDCLGNWAGQGRTADWLYIIAGVVAVLAFAHIVALLNLKGIPMSKIDFRSVTERAFSTAWQYVIGATGGAAALPTYPLVGGAIGAALASVVKSVGLPLYAKWATSKTFDAAVKVAEDVVKDVEKNPDAKPLIKAVEAKIEPVVAPVEAKLEPVAAPVVEAVVAAVRQELAAPAPVPTPVPAPAAP